ncbi:ribosome production factor 2 [Conidiobolus coronatus NRRL 28638]|uniref:Ribosome production factor 2 homolog n=1 Tax=Conidiobolus coronatus (strain ATCC 28846 / CBS 209.66 / NRRL 28638) TaxID=796925 RepID=A0A137P2C0_CONC2|nr:ribosome production factor 2 [Conidiobolus coronatus NRRL 28638]|eukprot:KXN69051.1 ribosome production factor 2 [Conidiobolus coronatus NRRL 28638]
MLRLAKPKNARSKRFLENRDPKVVENVKTCIFVKGSTTSQVVNNALSDLYQLKKPDAVNFTKKNDIHPFDDETSVEFFSQKNDAAFLVVGSHSKKRPHNLTFIRMFDYHIMDMMEVGITRSVSLNEFDSPKCAIGMKPCFLFNGEEWEQVEELVKFKNIILDLYHGQVANSVNLAGLEHVIVCTVGPTAEAGGLPTVLFRTYGIQLKKSGTRLPRAELEEMGPSFDFVIRRTRFATPDVWKAATRVPKELQPKKKKNISHDDLGDNYGRVHMEKQDFSQLQTRKMKGLKAHLDQPEAEGDDDEEDEDEDEEDEE